MTLALASDCRRPRRQNSNLIDEAIVLKTPSLNSFHRRADPAFDDRITVDAWALHDADSVGNLLAGNPLFDSAQTDPPGVP